MSELAELLRLCSSHTEVNDESSSLNSCRLLIIFDFSTIGELNNRVGGMEAICIIDFRLRFID